MEFAKQPTALKEIGFSPTTGGQQIVKYKIQEGSDLIDVSHGPRGIVIDFPDGACTVIQGDGGVITLRADGSMTISDQDGIEDLPYTAFPEMIGCFEHAVETALTDDTGE